MAIATWDAMIDRHNSLAQKLEAEIIRIPSVHCHVHRLASACCCVSADLYNVRKYESTLMQLLKCFTVSPLRSACLVRHQTTVKTKVGSCKLQRACKQGSCRVRQLCRARSDILAIWAALKQPWACAITWGTRPPTFSDSGDIICHVPPHFSL